MDNRGTEKNAQRNEALVLTARYVRKLFFLIYFTFKYA